MASVGCVVNDMRTCRSKALISRHLAMMASSSFGKSIDMVVYSRENTLDFVEDTSRLLSRTRILEDEVRFVCLARVGPDLDSPVTAKINFKV
jgi:hypothetical protein